MFNLKDLIINNSFLFGYYIKIKLFFEPKRFISKRRIAGLIRKDPTIVEIGAHVGSDTVEMAVLWPEGKIYAFEPVKNVFERLRFKTKNFKNVEIVQAAVSGKAAGSQEMYISRNNDCSSSLLKPKDHLLYCPEIYFRKETIPVRTLNLGEWLDENGVSRVDLLWIDVQGMELNIFKSLEDRINNIGCIYTEVSLREFYEGSGSYDEIKAYLHKYGFELVADDLTDRCLMGNALFKKVK